MPSPAKKQSDSPFDTDAALLHAFGTNHRINLYLLEHLSDDAWATEPLNGKGRSIRAIAAHMHNVRLMWLKAAGLPEGVTMPEKLDGADTHLTRERAGLAFAESWRALESVLLRGLKDNGRVKGFKPDVVSFFAYLLAHDAHHRGQISTLARQSGHALPQSAMFGMWEWGTR